MAPIGLLATETDSNAFVDLAVSPAAWGGLIAVIVALLAIDLYRHREAHVPTTRQALTETILWVSCGLGFSIVVLVAFGGDAFGEYLGGFLTEKALSVDNVFVWSILFTTLSIPVAYQHRVLFWGIFGALTLRAVFIFAGAALLDRFQILLIVFGGFTSMREAGEFAATAQQSAKTAGRSLEDLVVIDRPDYGRTLVTETTDITMLEAVVKGLLWGTVVGLTIAQPFVGAAIGGLVGIVRAVTVDLGIPDAVVRHYRRTLGRGESVVLVLDAANHTTQPGPDSAHLRPRRPTKASSAQSLPSHNHRSETVGPTTPTHSTPV